jgi:uncharacterized membrane protein
MNGKVSDNKEKKDMRIWISLILRTGVLVSAALLLAGGILFAFQHPGAEFSFKSFAGEPERLREVGSVFREALQIKSRAVIQLGIITLISTPVLRVIFSFIEFIIHRDWTFVLITAIVIGTLFYSLLG